MVQYDVACLAVDWQGLGLSRKKHLMTICTATVASTLLMFAGCPSRTNPWSGKPYQEPTGYSNPPQSIYAPMPSVLPSIDATSLETDESLEAELDLLIERD